MISCVILIRESKMQSIGSGRLITAKEAADYLKISIQTLYNLKCQGKLRGYNLGGSKKGKLYFLEGDLTALIIGKAV